MQRLCLGLVATAFLTGLAVAPAQEPTEDSKMKLVRRIEEPGKPLFSPTFLADGRRLIATGDGLLHLWDAVTGKKIAQLERPAGERFQRFALSPDGQTLAAVTGSTKTGLSNMIAVIDIKSGEIRYAFILPAVESGRVVDSGSFP